MHIKIANKHLIGTNIDKSKTEIINFVIYRLVSTNVKLAARSRCGFQQNYDCEVSSGKQMHIPAADTISKL